MGGDTSFPADDDLVAGIRAGRRDAFTQAFRRHQSDVYRFARHMTGDAGVADDVTQETFLELMRAPERYDAARGSLRGYLLGIARHMVARRLREQRWWGVPPGDELPDRPALDDPHEELCRAQDIARVQAAVAALAPAFRDALVSCDLLGLSYQEAAASLGCPVGTVRSRLHRARHQVGLALRTPDSQLEGAALRCLA
jgi:RNA polymerase sigma-70 factor (ECF subfamily)